ncbi:acyl-Coenzyme A oxidase [Chamberlinius hualienensis]
MALNVHVEIEIPSEQELEYASKNIIPDLPSGPLDMYRKKASFNWKRMKYILEGKETLELEQKIWMIVREDPVFHQVRPDASFDEVRKSTFMRTKRLVEYRRKLLPEHSMLDVPKNCAIIRCFALIDNSAMIKMFLSEAAFETTLLSLGSEQHFPILQEKRDGNLITGMLITEMSHGSNLKGLQTTATYDPETQEFVINTPNIGATKCWVGNLGKHATWGLLYAQLQTQDNKSRGLHVFVIPLRNPKTHQPFPGVVIGDMGPKIGLDGIDNGFVIFSNYRVPQRCLLNKNSDFNAKGKYKASIKDHSKRFSTSLGALTFGRLAIIRICAVNLMKCLTIAVRYSAVRRQFGINGDEELPVLEYQLQQFRLIPSIAAMYALECFSKLYTTQYIGFYLQLMSNEVENKEVATAELHAVCSSVKAVASWTVRDAIQNCREACGGHGYLKISELGNLRGDHDANMTYEGECNVLIQQTSNHLINILKSKKAGQTVLSPCGVLDFFNNFDEILATTLSNMKIDEIFPTEVILNAYKWLICYLANKSDQQIDEQLRHGSDVFTARNNSQVFHLRDLAIAFAEYVVLLRFSEMISNPSLPAEISAVLQRLYSLHGLCCLEKHLVTLYEGGYISGPNVTKLIHQTILNLCHDLKDDAVSLVDVFAPPDYVLNSPLGASDGHVYEHLYTAMVHRPGAFQLPEWWQELERLPEIPDNIISKL